MTAASALFLSFTVLASMSASAESLTLTGVGGANADGVYTYPYEFTITGSTTQTGVSLSCLSFNREVTVGESWNVNVANLSTITTTTDGSSVTALEEDAWLMSKYNTGYDGASNNEIQFAIWSILDPTQVNSTSAYNNSGAFDSTAQSLAAQAVTQAALEPSSFYNQFTLFTPVVPAGDTNPTLASNPANPSSWDGLGEPQQFLEYTPAPAPTPEPSSLMLFGTGLLGLGFVLRRGANSAASLAARS